jgi:DNA-binding winged helix-turn-helix (wHTH) protein
MPSDATDATIALAGFTFEAARLELRDAAGAPVALRAQALAVLDCLARQRGHVVTRDELMRAVWRDVVVTDGSLAQCINEIRQALGDSAHRIVQTAPKRGYRLVADSAPSTAACGPGRAFEQRIGFATSDDGARIAYAASGAGPVLLRAPHWMTHLEWDWRSLVYGPWIEGFSQRFRFVRYDGRNWGLSDRGVAPATLQRAADDMAANCAASRCSAFRAAAPSRSAMQRCTPNASATWCWLAASRAVDCIAARRRSRSSTSTPSAGWPKKAGRRTTRRFARS